MANISRHSFNIGTYGKNNEKSSRLKLLGQLGPNFVGMVLGWSPLKFFFVGSEVHPRCQPSVDIVLT